MAEKKQPPNRKKKALQRTKNKISQCINTVNTNPTSVDGSLPSGYDGSPTGGVDQFTSDLTSAWESARAQEFSDWIIGDVSEIRNAWRNISQNIDDAIKKTSPDDNVPEDNKEDSNPKWDKVP